MCFSINFQTSSWAFLFVCLFFFFDEIAFSSVLRNELKRFDLLRAPFYPSQKKKSWKKFCESLKESRAIENIPANELDLLLSKFFIFVRKQNGAEYEPGTKTRLLQPNSMTQTRRFLITLLERPVLDDFSKKTFSQTSLHS